MWGTDLTTTITEGSAAVFVAVDHCSAECVGIHAHARATHFEALEPIRQGVRQRFGGFAKDVAKSLAMRHDHGSPSMADHFQKALAFHRQLACLGPRARGQRLRRALHPQAEGEPGVGAELRNHRGAAPGAARVPPNIQHHLADRALRLHQPG
jgi:hypothetical protein